MPDSRKHRGPQQADPLLFGARELPRLHEAAGDYSWLLTRGYTQTSALKLVGDRYALKHRQRIALARAACSDQARDARRRKECTLEAAAGQSISVDGYNLITTVESALGGGVVLLARDRTFKDLAGLSGTYRKVEETLPALALIARACTDLDISIHFLLDQPVSNSGRLRQIILETQLPGALRWSAELVPDPDALLVKDSHIVASSDSRVLDGCARWLNLAGFIVRSYIPSAWLVDLFSD